MGLKQNLRSERTGEFLPAIVVATPMSRARTNGVLHVGVIHPSTDGVEQTAKSSGLCSDRSPTPPPFAYSSIDQLGDSRVALLFETGETNRWEINLKNMYMKEFNF